MIRNKSWTEVTIAGTPPVLEIVSAMLFDCGSCGSEEGKGWIKVIFPMTQSSRLRRCVDTVLDDLSHRGLKTSDPVYRIVKYEDWGSAWRERFQPVRISPRLLVIPAWMDDPKSEDSIVIRIMPRMAFGTGTHETTRLMMWLLEANLRSGWSVMDVGTGSGILAITAAKMGAGDVTAFDIDPAAIENAAENCRLNGVEDRVRLWCGPLEASETPPQDIILANIDDSTLVGLLPEIRKRIKAEGRIILSGILERDQSVFESVLSSSGYRTETVRTLGEWVAYVLLPPR